jgi:hypothetical protein
MFDLFPLSDFHYKHHHFICWLFFYHQEKYKYDKSLGNHMTESIASYRYNYFTSESVRTTETLRRDTGVKYPPSTIN